jgi:hypothetical protein
MFQKLIPLNIHMLEYCVTFGLFICKGNKRIRLYQILIFQAFEVSFFESSCSLGVADSPFLPHFLHIRFTPLYTIITKNEPMSHAFTVLYKHSQEIECLDFKFGIRSFVH